MRKGTTQIDAYTRKFLNVDLRTGGSVKSVLLSLLIIAGTCFAEGSRESDSLALVSFQEANNSIESRVLWDYTEPLEEWAGVTLENNRVVKLGFTFSRWTTIPSSIGELSELRSLKLSQNSFETISPDIWNLKKLQILNLAGSDLYVVPAEIGELTDLEIVHLGLTQITSLPEEIGKLSKLRIVNVNSNRISSLPESIGNLTNLTSLNVMQTGLSSFPQSIQNLTELDSLFIAYNNLSTLPTSFSSLELSYLSVTQNYLQEKNLTEDMIRWLDRYDGDWRDSQSEKHVSISNLTASPSNKSIYVNNLSVHFSSSAAYSISIFSASGRLLKQINGANPTLFLNTLGLANGIYQMRIVQGGDVFTGQFILK